MLEPSAQALAAALDPLALLKLPTQIEAQLSDIITRPAGVASVKRLPNDGLLRRPGRRFPGEGTIWLNG